MTNREENYQTLCRLLQSLIQGETDALANLANSAALLFYWMEKISWAGFYLLKGEQLVLGPFQGKPACLRIDLGKGVCGTAAQNKGPIVVQDVHQFPGHIACDSASASEVVIPILRDGELVGVLDIDSPVKARFQEEDARGLQDFTAILSAHIRWEELLH